MKNPIIRSCFFFISITCLACNQNADYQYSFYYWKNQGNNELDTVEMKAIRQLGGEHFYIHYMDVDWSESLGIPVPRTEVEPWQIRQYSSFTYTPVVFITNRTFERMPDAWCDTLAAKIADKVNGFSSYLDDWNISNQVNGQLQNIRGNDEEKIRDSIRRVFAKSWALKNYEIQIDCDWTPKTKDKYFLFLKKLKQLYPFKIISATIRLYPYKYPGKMGVPPVDKGMLMCYNLGNIRKANTDNSVFDLATLKQYLGNKKYSLPLDVALPMFGWYAWFRANHFKGIIYDSPELDAQQNSVFRKLNGEKYQLKADTVIQNNYLRQGDILRREFPDEEELVKANRIIQSSLKNVGRVAIYHWDYPSIMKHQDAIQKIFPQP